MHEHCLAQIVVQPQNQIKSNQTVLLAHIIQVVHFLGVTSVGGTLITLLGFLEPVKNKKEQ